MIKNRLDKIVDNTCIFVIFGGTGDLTKRKLIPAIYSLKKEKLLPENFYVLSIGRREKSLDQYRSELKNSTKEFSRYDFDENIWEELSKRIEYFKFDFIDNNDGYIQLENRLEIIEREFSTSGNRLYYLAVAPRFFSEIISKLGKYNKIGTGDFWNRVMVEKPFGSDLRSARILNEKITKVVPEKDIYRIDHYLGKEMFQNIFTVRFSNSIFEPLWNNMYIDNVQITSYESLGVENRGSYFEGSGILKDMIQNHLLQLISMIAMEPPVDFSDESIRSEKVKLLKSIYEYSEDEIEENIVRGQYGEGVINNKKVIGYRNEDRVAENSNIETFMALKLKINNFRWYGVPFYIRTGKRMNES
ncbi:MAG: glucose-6-phosphate dehydrogenase, partial [Clostridiales bacterium]